LAYLQLLVIQQEFSTHCFQVLKQIFYILIFCLLATSCDFFKSTDNREPIARVNDSYLYKEDVAGIVPEGASKEDSTLMVNAYVNRWARQLLLMDGALVNISEDKQSEFSRLVEQYKSDLYTKAYLEGLVKKNIDTDSSDNDSSDNDFTDED
jgi:hypothetical protein